MSFRRTKASLPPPDALLLILAGVVILFGLIALTSATGIVAYNKFGDAFFYVKRQVAFGVLPGLLFFSIAFFIPYTTWRRLAFPIYCFSLFLLLLIFIPGIGVSYGRARNWLNIAGFSLQPAEVAKVGLLLYLSVRFERRPSLLSFLVIAGIPLGLIALQPDVGTLGLVAIVAFVVYFVSGAAWKHIALLVVAGSGAFGLMIAAAPYRLARVLTFLSPGTDPSGAGYQLMQSLVAIGSGGLLGVGLGASRQKLQYLPEVAGDSIFSIMAEELGFIVMLVFLCVLFSFFYRGFRIARFATDQFSRLFVTGVFAWFLIQAILNIGSMVGILPLTGLPLPFVSYGGTALATSLFALGIVANISRYSHKT